MTFNINKLFEVDNGIGVDGGVNIASGDFNPLSITPPRVTLFIEPRGIEWFYEGSWKVGRYLNLIDNHVINYSGDNVTSIVYQKSGVRVIQVDLTRTGDNVTKEEQSLFGSDGTTLIRKITYNYAYTSGNITGFTKAES